VEGTGVASFRYDYLCVCLASLASSLKRVRRHQHQDQDFLSLLASSLKRVRRQWLLGIRGLLLSSRTQGLRIISIIQKRKKTLMLMLLFEIYDCSTRLFELDRELMPFKAYVLISAQCHDIVDPIYAV